MYKRLFVILIITIITLASACTPAEQALFRSLPKDQQDAVVRYLQTKNTPSDCYQAIDMYWPAQHRAKARQIVWRESRNIPTAKNPRSSARGCFQTLAMHNHRYAKVGCSPAQWSDPVCNTRVALTLFNEAGWRPWSV